MIIIYITQPKYRTTVLTYKVLLHNHYPVTVSITLNEKLIKCPQRQHQQLQPQAGRQTYKIPVWQMQQLSVMVWTECGSETCYNSWQSIKRHLRWSLILTTTSQLKCCQLKSLQETEQNWKDFFTQIKMWINNKGPRLPIPMEKIVYAGMSLTGKPLE